MNLNEQTQIIIHSAKSISSSIWTIVRHLIEIQEKQLYKEQNFNSMESYVEYYKEKDKFGFGYRQAQRYMVTAKELNIDDTKSPLSYSEASLIMQAAPEQRDTLLHQIENKEIKTTDQLARQVKRLKNQIGSPPAYKESEDEMDFKLIREWKTIKESLVGVKDSTSKWLESAKESSNEQVKEFTKEAIELLGWLR